MSSSSDAPNPQIVTLGCRLNIAESDMMREFALKQNLKHAIIVNTCAVTTEAERQARQTIRQLRKKNPDAFIIATGCAVQLRPEVFSKMPELDRVLGNAMKTSEEAFSPDFPYRVHVGALPKEIPDEATFPLPLENHSKAFLQVQNGCNHHCTFCTIPLARGRSRSVPLSVLIKQVQHLLDKGIQEIILTGVDLTSYDVEGMTLGTMIQRLLEAIPALQRLRLSSLDSMEVSSELSDLLIHEPRILPHIHLSLQAGSNTILQAMKRRHSREQAIALCQNLRRYRPALAFGADFIAGFPGETEEMFQETLDLVQACHLTHLHVFPFSGRPGTPASRMKDQVPHAIAKERTQRLRALGEQRLLQWYASQVGNTITVLPESPIKGHGDDFSVVYLTTPVPPHVICHARVIQANSTHLLAQPL
jgi:threonylcarbamoyladenosine tRNA methylthiotransferase MtaB